MNAGLMKNIGSNVTKIGARLLMKVRKASPELLIGGGILVVVAGTVMACKATKKVSAEVDEGMAAIEEIKTLVEEGTETPEDAKAEIREIKRGMIGTVVKAYAPAASILVAGSAMILTSHGIMKKRNGILLASYNALDAMFQRYRDNVKAMENGDELDKRYLLGDAYPPEDVNEVMSEDDAEGVNQTGMELANAMNPYGLYNFEFNKYTSGKWSPSAFSNLTVIRAAEDWADRQLRFRGYVFLNEVLEQLDMDPVPWGQLVGWLRFGEGDKRVLILAEEMKDAIEADDDIPKKAIQLEFNCDGAIWEKL